MASALVAGLGCALLQATACAAEAPLAGSFSAALRAEAAGYEHGSGVEKDVPRAIALYCNAARLSDGEAQFALGWIYAYGRGVPRNDALAAYFFEAAAEQGIAQAARMLQSVGRSAGQVPDCMVEPALSAPRLASVQLAPPAAPPMQASAPPALVKLVEQMAPAYQVDPRLVLAIMAAESNFDRTAVSPKNAMGLMQLLPETAARFNVKDPFDAKQNIRGGLSYLRWLLAYFEGDLRLVTAAYNAGERTVERYRGVPPYAETRTYVRRVVDAAGSLVHPFDARITRPSPVLRSIDGRQAAVTERLVDNRSR
jgi:soluble lytic murein transglycosylase-like protein